MSLKLYNSLSSKKEVFKSISDKKVKTYGCGPTVYNDPHIGNFRTFVFYDLLNRVLQLNGYETETAVNITDIDDKIIDRVNQENTSLKEITSKYELSFLELSKSLKILPNNHNPRATEYVEEMIEFIQALINQDLAYEMNGNIFFDIEAYPKYGKFVNISDDLETEDNELSKKNRNDFTLWKAKKDSDGDIFWNSEWGKGRPGWHTECAVMIKTLFDGRLDIHCGGIDLKFPHHENESAQIEAIQKHNLSNYWLHAEHLNMDDEKMSKSLGNFIDVSTLIEKNGSDVVRLFLLSAHYRTKVSFSQKKLNECNKMIEKIKRFAKNFEKDCILKRTTEGPHKRSFNILLNNADASETLSRGQQKIISIIFHLIQREIIIEHTKLTPILLMDDISSELDKENANLMLKYLINNRVQTIMTSINFSHFANHNDVVLFHVEHNGECSNVK